MPKPCCPTCQTQAITRIEATPTPNVSLYECRQCVGRFTASDATADATPPGYRAPRSATAAGRRVETARHYQTEAPGITHFPMSPPKPLEFEPLDTNLPGVTVLRARIPGGYLTTMQANTPTGPDHLLVNPLTSLVFIPLEAW